MPSYISSGLYRIHDGKWGEFLLQLSKRQQQQQLVLLYGPKFLFTADSYSILIYI